jgi:hypothetical protein
MPWFTSSMGTNYALERASLNAGIGSGLFLLADLNWNGRQHGYLGCLARSGLLFISSLGSWYAIDKLSPDDTVAEFVFVPCLGGLVYGGITALTPEINLTYFAERAAMGMGALFLGAGMRYFLANVVFT